MGLSSEEPPRLRLPNRELAEIVEAIIGYKRAGRSHAYAHRPALVDEMIAARNHFGEQRALKHYLCWRIEGYPRSKVPDPVAVVEHIEKLLSRQPVPRGKLLDVIKQHSLYGVRGMPSVPQCRGELLSK